MYQAVSWYTRCIWSACVCDPHGVTRCFGRVWITVSRCIKYCQSLGDVPHRREAGEALPPPPKTAIAGPEYFGLTHPQVQAQIEALDPGGLCADYWEGKEVPIPHPSRLGHENKPCGCASHLYSMHAVPWRMQRSALLLGSCSWRGSQGAPTLSGGKI